MGLDRPDSTTAEAAATVGIGSMTAETVLAAMQERGLVQRDPDAAGASGGRWMIPTAWPAAEAQPGDCGDAVPALAAGPEPEPEPDRERELGDADPVGCSAGEGSQPAACVLVPLASDDGTGGGSEPLAVPGTPALEAGGGAGQPPSGVGVPAGAACPTCGHVRRAPGLRVVSGSGSRLGQGQLHQMALDHLRAHPTEEWTATGVARVIGRSSGAIANALATMASRGEAEMTCAAPRRYRALPAGGGPTAE
jgi:hypothetical protein